MSSSKPAEVFSRIRNFLAGRHIGATRDSALFDQVLICLFAKLYLAKKCRDPAGQLVGSATRRHYETAIRDLRRILGPNLLPHVTLALDDPSLEYIDRTMSALNLSAEGGDLIGDAYQCFHGSEVRGQEGQFFTPLPAIRLLTALIDPKPGELIIDPACGVGGFLFWTTQHLLNSGASVKEAQRCVYGVEKDGYLARLARMRVSLLTLLPTKVFAGDSLAWLPTETGSFMEVIEPGSYDVVLTNPPFGVKIVAASEEVRRQFDLAYRWISTADAGFTRSRELLPNTPPQVLFLERCISLVRPGGRIGMVVPESLLSGKHYRYVTDYILRSTSVEAVVGMPDALFKTSGKGGTHTKTALINLRKRPVATKGRRVFMAESTWCGHDSRGRAVPRDDTPAILSNYLAWKCNPSRLRRGPLGFALSVDEIKDGVLAPRAYDPELPVLLESKTATHLLVRFGDLVRQGVLSVSNGDEVGKLAYGTGEIPFVRTSDLSNWEIKLDPKHGVSRRIYEALRERQDVRPGDVLFVKDGTYLIGTCAVVTKYDAEIVLQSHIYKIRVLDNDMLDPYLLLVLLSSPLVQRQVRALCRTQDIINSLGNRIHDLILPIPREKEKRQQVSELVQRVVTERTEARELARRALEDV